jgi:hypothetical protein
VSGIYVLTLALLAVVSLAVARSVARRRKRREEARSIAGELIPEIRAILAACESGSGDRNAAEPQAPARYRLLRQRLPRSLPAETLFAVETFYQTLDAYGSAAGEMREAFAEESERSLGDRIRAKDRRDRFLKDLYYTGQAAVERLSQSVD